MLLNENKLVKSIHININGKQPKLYLHLTKATAYQDAMTLFQLDAGDAASQGVLDSKLGVIRVNGLENIIKTIQTMRNTQWLTSGNKAMLAQQLKSLISAEELEALFEQSQESLLAPLAASAVASSASLLNGIEALEPADLAAATQVATKAVMEGTDESLRLLEVLLGDGMPQLRRQQLMMAKAKVSANAPSIYCCDFMERVADFQIGRLALFLGVSAEEHHSLRDEKYEQAWQTWLATYRERMHGVPEEQRRTAWTEWVEGYELCIQDIKEACIATLLAFPTLPTLIGTPIASLDELEIFVRRKFEEKIAEGVFPAVPTTSDAHTLEEFKRQMTNVRVFAVDHRTQLEAGREREVDEWHALDREATAYKKKHESDIEELLNKNGTPDLPEIYHFKDEAARKRIVKILTNAKLSPDTRVGGTPWVHLALKHRKTNVYDLLRARGANVRAVDEFNHTPRRAAGFAHVDLAVAKPAAARRVVERDETIDAAAAQLLTQIKAVLDTAKKDLETDVHVSFLVRDSTSHPIGTLIATSMGSSAGVIAAKQAVLASLYPRCQLAVQSRKLSDFKKLFNAIGNQYIVSSLSWIRKEIFFRPLRKLLAEFSLNNPNFDPTNVTPPSMVDMERVMGSQAVANRKLQEEKEQLTQSEAQLNRQVSSLKSENEELRRNLAVTTTRNEALVVANMTLELERAEEREWAQNELDLRDKQIVDLHEMVAEDRAQINENGKTTAALAGLVTRLSDQVALMAQQQGTQIVPAPAVIAAPRVVPALHASSQRFSSFSSPQRERPLAAAAAAPGGSPGNSFSCSPESPIAASKRRGSYLNKHVGAGDAAAAISPQHCERALAAVAAEASDGSSASSSSSSSPESATTLSKRSGSFLDRHTGAIPPLRLASDDPAPRSAFSLTNGK